MAAELAVDRFWSLLGRSRLLPEEQVQQLIEQFGEPGSELSDSGKIAEALVAREVLTPWQAGMLLQGKHRGFILGPYRILRPLGKGGMGAVFLAEHQRMKRRCAIKVLPSDHSKRESSMLDRFYREAQAVAALDHPNIVRAYDVNSSVENNKEIHYLVMEYVDGQDLQHVVAEKGVLDYRQAADLIRQAAEGLAHAHEAGLVHRDIKPANLLVDSKGVVKVLDLGLAMFFSDEGQASLTNQIGDTVLGTADYLAPEQALDSHSVDARADIYSLGQTFYFLLAGHPPFPDGTVAQRLMCHQMKEPEPINKSRPDAPLSLLMIIKKMTAKKPAERYQTAAEVAVVLSEWLGRHGEGSGFLRRQSFPAEDSKIGKKLRLEPTRRTSDHTVETDLELAPLDDEPARPGASGKLSGSSSALSGGSGKLSGSSGKLSGAGGKLSGSSIRLSGSSSKLQSKKGDSRGGGSKDRLSASQSDALAASYPGKPHPVDDEPDDSEEGDEYRLSGEAAPSSPPAAKDHEQPSTPPPPATGGDLLEEDPFSAPLAPSMPLPTPLAKPLAEAPRPKKKPAKEAERGALSMILESGFFWIGVAVVVVLALVIAIVATRPSGEEAGGPPKESPPQPAASSVAEGAHRPPSEKRSEEPRVAAGQKPASPSSEQASSSRASSTAEREPPAEAPKPKPKRGGQWKKGTVSAQTPSTDAPPAEPASNSPAETAPRGEAKPPAAAATPPAPAPFSAPEAAPKPDTGALFAAVGKVGCNWESSQKSDDPLRMLILREAGDAVKKIGAEPTLEKTPAVLRLVLEENQDRGYVRLVLSGRLEWRVSESQSVTLWEHQSEVASGVRDVLLGSRMHPAVREGVKGFFEQFVAAHRKAREAVEKRSP